MEENCVTFPEDICQKWYAERCRPQIKSLFNCKIKKKMSAKQKSFSIYSFERKKYICFPETEQMF